MVATTPVPDRDRELGSSEWRAAFERRLQLQSRIHRLARWRAVHPGAPRFVDGNRLVYLDDGEHQLAWMLEVIRRARRRIDLEMYIFRSDEVGHLVRDALVAAARRGVLVRVLYDSIGAASAGAPFFEPLVLAGGHAVEFNPIAPWRLRIAAIGRLQAWRPNARDHRKLLICDAPRGWGERAPDPSGRGPPRETAVGQGAAGLKEDLDDAEETVVAITGGRNVAVEYLARPIDDGQWRDGGVVVLGPVGVTLGEMFDAMWAHAAGPPVDAPPLSSGAIGATPVLPLGSQPGLANLLQWSMARLAATVRRELRISCAYFIPSLRWRRSLRRVARRTGSCSIVIPLHNDIPVVAAASRHFLGSLLRGGVRIFRYARSVLHDKTLVYDRAITVIGSSNVDQRSFRKNYELSLLVLDRTFAETVAERHDRDIEASEPYTLALWRARPFWEKAFDWFWSLFRNQL
jgi:cardiolipin synthase